MVERQPTRRRSILACCGTPAESGPSWRAGCRDATMTPRGVAVEPDVYCRKARLSGVRDGSRHLAESASQSSISVVCQGSAGNPGSSASISATSTWTSAVLRIATGHASSTIDRNRPRLRGRGGYAGTATAPAYRQPKNAATNSSPARREAAPARLPRQAPAAPRRWREPCGPDRHTSTGPLHRGHHSGMRRPAAPGCADARVRSIDTRFSNASGVVSMVVLSGH